MYKQRSLIFMILAVLLLLLAACGGAATPAPAPKEEAKPTEAPKEAPKKEEVKPTEAPKEEAKPTEAAKEEPAGGEVYAGFVPPALTSPFHVAMVDGANAQAKELGWKLDVQAPASEGDFAAFVTTVEQLLEKGVQYISINPIGTDSAITAVKAANDKKVPILAHNFITPFSEGKVASYIGYDQWGGAEKLAAYTCELIAKKYNSTPADTKGKVFILLGIDSIFSHRRTGGFKAGLTKNCPNVEIVGEQSAEWLRTKGSEVAAIALQKDPKIDVFYGNSDEMAIGAALAAEQLGLKINKDFFAVGIDGNQPTLDLLKEGKFSATLGVDPVRMGKTVVDTMEKIKKGEEVPEITLTPSVVVSPDNLQDYLDGKLWTDPVAGFPELDNDKPTVPEKEAAAETKPAATGEKYVGFVPPALTSPFHVAMVDGATARAKELGWKLDVQAPASEGDFAAFVTTVEQLLEKGVQGISINPIGTDSAITAVKAANDKKVPILAHNFITPFSEGTVDTYLGYDQWGGAEKLAAYTCELIAKKYNSTPADTKGKVFILLGIDSIFSHRRTGGFKAGLTKNCPNVEIVGEQSAEWLRTKGSEVAAIALQKDPKIDVFYGNSDEMAIGAALAAEQLGLKINKDFFAVGIDGNQPTLDLLKEGKFSATLGVDPYRMGVAVIDSMDKLFKGEKLPEVTLTPSVVVSPDNLQDYLDGKLWTEPVAGSPELDNDKPTVPEKEAAAETKPAATGEKYVGFVPPALTSPFHVAMVDGATARAKELGWKLDVQAPASEGDFAAFVTTVEQLLEKGVQGISINPIGTDSAITAVKAANDKKVPILAHNFITPFSEGTVDTYLGYDQWGGAEKLAAYTCELIAKKYNSTPADTKGKVFILLGIDSIFSHRRTGGFKAGLTKNCPNVEIVGEQSAEWLRTKGSEVAAIALQKDPKIDVFYGNSDEMAIGAALAAEQLGLKINKDFFAVGIDGNQPTLDLLKEGKFSATLGVDPYRMGVAVIDSMDKLFKGEKLPEVTLTPSVVVSPDNLQDYLDGKLWTEPVAGSPELDNDKPTVPEK